MKTIPEPTEQQIIASLGYDGHMVLYYEIELDEDYGLMARMDREIREGLKERNGNDKHLMRRD